jgi:peroxiredoxin
MMMTSPRPPISPGEPAPDFVLPAINQDGALSLSDYRGQPLLLAMMRGLYCAFCRRHIAQLGATRAKLQPLGVEVLAIVGMDVERARLYYRHRPVSVPLAADADLVTHRAYGVPQPALTVDILQTVETRYLDLARELKLGASDIAGVKDALCRLDGFVPVEAELKGRRDWSEQHGGQLIGQFLVDADGIVRWVNIEGAREGLAGLEKFPSDDEFVEAARRLRN